MKRSIDVTRARAHSFRLRALHDRLEPAVVETDDLVGGLDDHAEFIVVLASGDSGAVRSRAHLN